jgi:hypothetical protein
MRYLISLTLSVYLAFQPAFATLNEVDKASIFSKNMLKNGGFENGKASWTVAGGTFAVTTSSPMVGLMHATWDAAASADTLTSGDITIPAGFFTRNGVASCVFTTPSGTATHEIQVYDGANILSETTITSSTSPTRTSTNFTFPSSASVSVRIYANQNESSISIDDCYLGPAEGYNVSNVSQATFVGESYFVGTSLCNWARTSATIGAFTADAQCPGPTILNSQLGTWATTDVDLPEQTITNLPPGIYEATFIFNANSSGVSNITYAINDGTTTCNGVGGSTATTPAGHNVSCSFTYTTAGTRNFELYAASAASTANLNGDVTSPQQNVRFMLKRFPTTSETAYTADVTAWKVDANISGANITLGSSAQAAYVAPNNGSLTLTQNTGSTSVGISCSSTNDNSVGSTTCSAGSEEPGIVVNVPRAGIMEMCVAFTHLVSHSSTSSIYATFQVTRTANGSQTIAEEGKSRIYSGASTTAAGFTHLLPQNLCGTFNITTAGKHTFRLMYEMPAATITTHNIVADADANNGQRDIHITAKMIDQSFPAPNLVNSVVSPSSGVERIASVFVTDGAVTTTISRETGDWISGVCTNASTGIYVCTFVAGTFSSTPNCLATTLQSGGGAYESRMEAISSSSVEMRFYTNDGTLADSNFTLFCMGPK